MEDTIQLAIQEISRRTNMVLNRPDVFIGTFAQQKAFILDPALLKALFCTRRSAKSYTAGIYLIYTALMNPGCNCLFIGLTRASAKAIIWKDILRVLNHKFKLGADFNQTELTMTLPNGSVIAVTGVDAEQDEMNKLLGRKYRLVCIDEASMYTINVHNLVYGVLGPAMTDPNLGGQRGTICLLGTASDFPRGLFYDVTTRKEPGWQVFEWTAHDNPYVAKQWQEALDDIAQNRPLYMETPQFKQWYLNQWVVDEEKLVYRFSQERNLCSNLPTLPQSGWSYVLGVDTGWEDDNAFVLTAYHAHDPKLYVVKSYKQKKLTFDQVAAVIQDFMKDPVMAPHKVFIDGANKQGVESMRQRSAIPFEYADKQDKVTFIELCNSDLQMGRIQILDVPSNRHLWQEMAALVWVTDGEKIKIPKKEHPNLPNHLCDAFLYAWRNGYHYHSEPAIPKIPIGSKAWYDQQAEGIWERERERLIEESNQQLWPTEDTIF
jgi:phage terminase large subunit